jgi:hypothetical protein
VRRRRVASAVLVAGIVLAGCDGEPGSTTPTETADGAPTDEQATTDPRREALEAAIVEVTATVTAARDHLVRAAEEGDPAPATVAVARLTADEDLAAGATPDGPPLLPGADSTRAETIDYGDVFTLALEASRDAGGALGADLSRVLSDTVVGDLGTWQRDPAGVLETVDRLATGGDVEAAEPAILDELAGEGLRALAWALFAARADDPATVTAASERATAHLGVILASLEALDPTGSDDADAHTGTAPGTGA